MSGQAPNASAHVLVVDDDARLRSLLQRYLGEHGYSVSVAASCAEALAATRNLTFDLIVLDVMLPDGSGVQLTRTLRAERDTPILLLTARGEPDDRIAGLEAGAEDYLGKPFEPRELLLRMAAILRRVAPAGRSAERRSLVRFGPFEFDLELAELRENGEPVHLTQGEAALLRLLAEQPGQVLSRAALAERAGIDGSDRAVDVQMTRLRRKIEPDARQPRWLLTIRGEGYALRAASV